MIMASYHEIWTSMNKLSESVTNFLTVRDLIRDHYEDDKVMEAAVVLIEHFVEKYDESFEEAWKVTIEAGNELDRLKEQDSLSVQDKKYEAQYTSQEVVQDMNVIEKFIDKS